MRAAVCATVAAALLLAIAPAARAQSVDKLPQLTRKVDPTYPPKALADRVEATVVLDVNIADDGTVDTVTVVSTEVRAEDGSLIESHTGAEQDSYGFAQAAIIAGTQLEFSPAESAGKPVAVRIQYTYRFRPPPPPIQPPRLDNLVTKPPPGLTGPPPVPVVNLRGVLVERGTRVPVAGATVTVYRGEGDSAEGFDATTDASGEFVFYDLAPGEWNVLAQREGYIKFETRETIKPGEMLDVKYYIEKGSYNPYDVTVEVEPPKKEVNRRTLNSADISKVPGTLGDPVLVIENLPGVARTQPGQIVVRGSGPEDTGVFIDGAIVPLIYHFGGLKSVLPAEVVDSVDFYPGNYSVQYGRGMGGVFDLHIKRIEPKQVHGSADISVLDTSLYLETPVGKHGAVAVAGRRSYIGSVLDAVIPADSGIGLISAPRYYDFQVLGNWRPDPKQDVRLLFLGSDDLFELLFEDPSEQAGTVANSGSLTARTSFQRLMAEYRYTPDQKLSNKLKLSLGRDKIYFAALDVFRFQITQYALQLRDTASVQVDPHVRVNAGIDAIGIAFSGEVLAPEPPREGQPQNQFNPDRVLFSKFDSNAAAIAPFVEAEINVGHASLVPGLRADYFGLTGEYSVDPRIVARYDFDKFAVKAGAAVVHQEPQPFETDKIFGNPDLKLQKAYQYSAGGEWRPLDQLNIDLTFFYKDMKNLVRPTGDFVVRDGQSVPKRYDNAGVGKVYGAEVFAEHKFANNFRGWLSYTLSRALRRDSPGGEERLFDYDQTHILAIVASYVLPRNWELGLRWRIVSGSPTTPVIGSVFVNERDQYVPLYGATNSGRLPTFQQLDLRVDKTWVFDTWKLGGYISLLNAYNYENVEQLTYNFDYSQKGSVKGLPIIPILGVKGEW